MSGAGETGIVLIGRNEGARLVRAFAAIPPEITRRVYVDSGSTDGSLEVAQAAGAKIVLLDTDLPFTAARARNAGIAALAAGGVPDYIQFIDGDCELQPGWIATARAFLEAHPKVAVVCGRRRERFPEASFWNRIVDEEWNTPVGEARACGGDALMRSAPLIAAGGYDPALIAGEEPELCVRLRAAGWKIWRLDAEMTMHDAAMTRFGQWWQRARRAGYAYAQGAAMHGRPPERHKVRETQSALAWGVLLPLTALAGTLLWSPWALALMLAYPLQVLRLVCKGYSRSRALVLTFAKLPEGQGVLTYLWRRLTGARARLIEYK